MLEEDLAALDVQTGGHDGVRGLLSLWGWDIPDHWELSDQVFADLDEATGGVRWWGTQLDQQKRRLIGDFLFDATSEVTASLIETKVHLSSYVRATNDEESRLRFAPVGGGRMYANPQTPVEHLDQRRMGQELTGIFRGAGSVLDALAMVIIGVTSAPIDLRKAGWRHIKDFDLPEPLAGRLDVQAAVAAAGPPGWLGWTLEMRNALVHRPRPLKLLYVRPFYEPEGAKLLAFLPRNPGDSFVESFARAKRMNDAMLGEDARQTVAGIATSIVALIRELSPQLLDVWQWRRDNPDALPQPERQWSTAPPQPTGFDGYTAGEGIPQKPEVGLMLAPATARRLQVAAASDDARQRVWGGWPPRP